MTEKGKYLCPHCLKEHPREIDYCPEKELAVVETYRLEGEIIDEKYRIGEKIGAGGMGVVYKATHLNIGRTLAVKFLHFDLQTSETVATRFKNEARAAAAVGHKNIVDIIDMGKLRDKFHYIVMEYIEGEDLRDILDAKRKLPIHEATQIAMQVLSGLRAVHAKNILHRDLKPDNIFITPEPDGEKFVKIVDFGICRVSQDVASSAKKLTMEGVVCGTPTYMAPEAAKGSEDMDHRADLYSVGTILYEMVTGRPPFASSSVLELFHKIINETAKSPHELDPSIPVEFSDAVMKALAKSPDDRYQSASDFIDAIGMFSSKQLNRMLVKKVPVTPAEISIPAEFVTGESPDSEISVQLVVNEDTLAKLLPAAPAPSTAPPRRREEISITISEEIKVPLASQPPPPPPRPAPAEAQPEVKVQPGSSDQRTATASKPTAASPAPTPLAAEPVVREPAEPRGPAQPPAAAPQAETAAKEAPVEAIGGKERPRAQAEEPRSEEEKPKAKRRGASAFFVILLILAVSAGALYYYDTQHSGQILSKINSMFHGGSGTAVPAGDALEEAGNAAHEAAAALAADLPAAPAPDSSEDTEEDGEGEDDGGKEIDAADDRGEETAEIADAFVQEAAVGTWTVSFINLPEEASVYIDGVLHTERPVLVEASEGSCKIQVQKGSRTMYLKRHHVDGDIEITLKAAEPEKTAAPEKAAVHNKAPAHEKTQGKAPKTKKKKAKAKKGMQFVTD